MIQLICVVVAIPVLLGLAFIFGMRQTATLFRLREGPELPAEESRHERHQAYRRLVSCGLLALLALLLAGAQLFLEEKADAWAAVPVAERTPEHRDFVRFYGAYWLGCLLVLLAVVGLAGVDLWQTRRRGMRERRKLLDDKRVMLERQMTRYRRERGE